MEALTPFPPSSLATLGRSPVIHDVTCHKKKRMAHDLDLYVLSAWSIPALVVNVVGFQHPGSWTSWTVESDTEGRHTQSGNAQSIT